MSQINTKMNPDYAAMIREHLPGIFGSVLYFLYMRVYHNVPLKKSLVALLAGCLMASFLGPQFIAWFPGANAGTLGFLVGFLGMKMAEGFVSVDVKGIVKKGVERPLK